MRFRLTMGMTRASLMGSLATVGLVLNQVGPVQAQFPIGNSGDTTRNAQPGNPAPTPVLTRDRAAGIDEQMFLAHALEMVIEGSNLQLVAMGSGSPAVGNPGTGGTQLLSQAELARAGYSGTPPSVAVPSTTPTPTPAPNGASPGTGFTGRSGETVSGRPVGSGTGTVAPSIPGSTQAVQLFTIQLRAQQTMETGDRLLRQAGREAAVNGRFSQAATAYATTLRRLVGRPADRVDGAGAVIGSATLGTPAPGSNLVNAAPTVILNGTDRESIALINHAVQDALGAMKIKEYVRLKGSVDSPAIQALLDHAREMETESNSINPILNASAGGLQSATVQALAQQARELIQALHVTVGEGNATPGR